MRPSILYFMRQSGIAAPANYGMTLSFRYTGSPEGKLFTCLAPFRRFLVRFLGSLSLVLYLYLEFILSFELDLCSF